MDKNKQIRDFCESVLYDHYKSRSRKMENCQYYVGVPERRKYCRATTNISCLRCEFYRPTHKEKLKMLANAIKDAFAQKEMAEAKAEDCFNQMIADRALMNAKMNRFAEEHFMLKDALAVCDDAEILK